MYSLSQPGIQARKRFHRHSRSCSQYCSWLLAHDLGTEYSHHCHGNQSRGERKSKCVKKVMVCYRFENLWLCRWNVINIGLMRKQTSTALCKCMFGKYWSWLSTLSGHFLSQKMTPRMKELWLSIITPSGQIMVCLSTPHLCCTLSVKLWCLTQPTLGQ